MLYAADTWTFTLELDASDTQNVDLEKNVQD